MLRSTTLEYVKWVAPGPRPVSAACFDLDDTLASYCKDLGLRACADFPPTSLLDTALRYQAAGVGIIIASARPEWCFDGTMEWCARHGLQPAAIYLKNRRCDLPAHLLKEHMLRDILRQHQIEVFYDDNPYCCLAARDMGVPALWVEGNEEYWLPRGQEEGWLQGRDLCGLPAVRL